MYHLFIDEAGNASHVTSNRHTQRYLNLTGVIIHNDDLIDVFMAFNTLRGDHFGHSPQRRIVLHRVQLASGKGVYACLRDFEKRCSWEADCLGFLKTAKLEAITVTIDKVAFYYRHPRWVGEPYDLCAFNMIERFCWFLKHRNETGRVHLETRNPKQDALFEAAFNRFVADGNRYISPAEAKMRVGQKSVKFWTKNDDQIGCQLADLASQPLLEESRRRFTGIDQTTRWNRMVAMGFWPKLYRDSRGRLDGCGLVWRPNEKRPS